MLHIIFGPMFSGKTSYLLNELEKYNISQIPAVAICHELDRQRKDGNVLKSHNDRRCPAFHCEYLSTFMNSNEYKNASVIGIDEAQFFPDLVAAVKLMVDRDNKIVFVAGLDGNAYRSEFGSLVYLIPHCDSVIKLSAVCQLCPPGCMKPAPFTIHNDLNVLVKKEMQDVGGSEKYRAVCRKHYLEHQKKFQQINK